MKAQLSSEHELLNAIMESKREDLPARSMQKCKQYYTEEDQDVKVKYHKAVAAAALGAIFRVWLLNGRKESPEDLLGIMEGIVRG